MDEQTRSFLVFAEQLAREAGHIMKRYFNAPDIATQDKTNHTPITIADTTINQRVIEAVQQTFPDHGVLGEEDSYAVDRKFLWVCDPIDGTFPYAHGIPVFTFSLALVVHGRPLVAVIYDPMLDRMVTAAQGHGAYLNGDLIKLQDEYPVLGMRGVEVEVWGDNDAALFDDPELQFTIDRALAKAGFMNLFFCSVAYHGLLCAIGKSVGVVFGGRNAWDMAATALIVCEAGGVVSDCFGNRDDLRFDQPINGIIAARTEHEYQQLADAVLPHFAQAKRRTS